MNPLQRILLDIVIAMALVGAGFGSGYYTKGKFDKADQVAQVTQVVKDQQKARGDDAVNVADSQQKSAELDRKIDAGADETQSTKKEIKKYAPRADVRPNHVQPETGAEVPRQPSVCPPDFSFLSRGELWLLDGVRQGGRRTADYAAGRSDEEGRTPSDVSRPEFIDGDIEAVGQYNELKERHNALVEYVERMQAAQRKRLGVSE
jgi:hypothetical protein